VKGETRLPERRLGQEKRLAPFPEDELFFIIGADAFAEIRTWLRWCAVARADIASVRSQSRNSPFLKRGPKKISCDQSTTRKTRQNHSIGGRFYVLETFSSG
jgi:nicotinic acid mononucleotide adenylyltransferase